MTKTICTIMRNFRLIRLLACFFALSLSFVGTTSAFASPKTHFAPNAITVFCLDEAANITGRGPNEVNVFGLTKNDCGHSAFVTQKIVITNGCEGTLGTGSLVEIDSLPIDATKILLAPYVIDAGCVTCEYSIDGVLIDQTYPNFVVIVNVTATGSFKVGPNTYLAADNGTATARFFITNTRKYAPPCPRVV